MSCNSCLYRKAQNELPDRLVGCTKQVSILLTHLKSQVEFFEIKLGTKKSVCMRWHGVTYLATNRPPRICICV